MPAGYIWGHEYSADRMVVLSCQSEKNSWSYSSKALRHICRHVKRSTGDVSQQRVAPGWLVATPVALGHGTCVLTMSVGYPAEPQQVCVSRQRAKSSNGKCNRSAKGGRMDSAPRSVCVYKYSARIIRTYRQIAEHYRLASPPAVGEHVACSTVE